MAPVHASKVFTAVQKKPPHSYKRNAAVFGLVRVEAGAGGVGVSFSYLIMKRNINHCFF